MVAWLVRLLARVVCALPESTALRLGGFLGLVWFHVVRIRRPTVLRQLRASFPDWPAPRVRAVARSLYANLGRYAVEFLRIAGPERTRDETARRARVSGLEAYERAVAAGRGVIVVTAHLGNWDLAGCSQALAGRRLTLLSRRLSNRGLNRLWMDRRRSLGLSILEESARLTDLAAVLRSGGTLVLLIDQATPPGRGGVLVDFLGRPAWTTRLPALLALRTGAPIVPVFAESLADGSHEIHVEEPLAAGVSPDGPDAAVADRVVSITREINARLEARVRTRPDQWLWLHRRWRSPPAGSTLEP
jgi:KDO2-lipid IV(A) lauroyltransferase